MNPLLIEIRINKKGTLSIPGIGLCSMLEKKVVKKFDSEKKKKQTTQAFPAHC